MSTDRVTGIARRDVLRWVGAGALGAATVIGVAIEKAIEGADVRAVLEKAQKEFQELLDKTEKG